LLPFRCGSARCRRAAFGAAPKCLTAAAGLLSQFRYQCVIEVTWLI
jgi:hypothetical protein